MIKANTFIPGLEEATSTQLTHKCLRFPGGELHVTLDHVYNLIYPITITAHLYNSDDIFELILLTDALRRLYHVPINLICPYLPYARQDRVSNSGESLSLKVFCDLINSLNFASVTVWDVHSNVSLALLNNVRNIPASNWTDLIVRKDHILIAPDVGSLKKVQACAKKYNNHIIQGVKNRNSKTGEILSIEIYDDKIYDHEEFLVIDDICDGGSTFIELSKKLNRLTDGHIDLYVTHGIFSKGVDALSKSYDEIYCPNIWTGIPNHRILTRLK